MSKWHQKDSVRLGLLVLCIVLIGCLYVYLHQHGLIGGRLPIVMRELAQRGGWWGPLIVLMTFALQTIVPVPNIVLAATTGALYGPWFGSVLVVIGWMISANVSFFAGRYFGRHWLEQHASEWLKSYAGLLNAKGFQTVFFMRLVQIPADVVGVVCGMTRIAYLDYLVASFFGILPAAITFTVLGRSWNRPIAWAVFGFLFLGSIGCAMLVRKSKWFNK